MFICHSERSRRISICYSSLPELHSKRFLDFARNDKRLFRARNFLLRRRRRLLFWVNNIGRNAQCLCGSGKKYKHCCLGKVDWNSLSRQPMTIQTRYLTVRGKNQLFMAVLGKVLQLDKIDQPASYIDFKRAFTPQAVREIYSAIPEIW